VVEKWILTMEPGSRATAVLYRPKAAKGRMPAIVLTFGHGGSKSQWQYNFAGQLYARMGLACLAIDPIGEEERHVQGKLGTRAHDPAAVHERADAAGRLIMGKLVFDTMRGIDYLMTREDIDPDRIGVAGNSLGGAKATWMLAVEPRIKTAIVSGWAFDDSLGTASKLCTRVPIQRMRTLCTWPEYLSLAAGHCAVLAVNGDADVIIDRDGDGTAWRGTRAAVAAARPRFEEKGASIRYWFEPGGGHRPYMTYKVALEWIHEHLGTPGWDLEKIRALPTINSQVYMDRNGVKAEKLYGTKLHQYGASLPDLGIRLIPRGQMACLREEERGADAFTLAGWLKWIEGQR
jgi:poly(3-hydroxybutyrate) depolymerase